MTHDDNVTTAQETIPNVNLLAIAQPRTPGRRESRAPTHSDEHPADNGTNFPLRIGHGFNRDHCRLRDDMPHKSRK